jgi:hypothetical protein
MDAELVKAVIDRDLAPFAEQARRLGLGTPQRTGTRLDLIVLPPGSADPFRAVLECDDYDAQAPLLDFADVETGQHVGREHWPRMRRATELGIYNSVTLPDGRYVPILCTPGTRGYHLHPSHCTETHPATCWKLACQATLLHRLFHVWGPCDGRGV